MDLFYVGIFAFLFVAGFSFWWVGKVATDDPTLPSGWHIISPDSHKTPKEWFHDYPFDKFDS